MEVRVWYLRRYQDLELLVTYGELSSRLVGSVAKTTWRQFKLQVLSWRLPARHEIDLVPH